MVQRPAGRGCAAIISIGSVFLDAEIATTFGINLNYLKSGAEGVR